jgi:4-hydroxybenzoate polyprenyltransferase
MNRLYIACQLLLRPFTNRLKLGEGGLVVFNILHSLVTQKNIQTKVAEALISLFVMSVLYGYNDYVDCEKDRLNPKKDQIFLTLICDNKRTFIFLIIFIQFLTLFCSWYFLGKLTALLLGILFFTNFLYSQKAKAIPAFDIAIVSLWGGLYVCLVGNFHWYIVLAAGLMTGIAHFFQVITDRSSDARNSINTSAVALQGFEAIILFLQCFLLGVVVYTAGNSWYALFCTIPFFAYWFSRRVTFSWYVARVVFLILWITLMIETYGPI